jgi:hypothetical protein
MTGKRFSINQFMASRPTVTIGEFGAVPAVIGSFSLAGMPADEPVPEPAPVRQAASLNGKPVRVVEDFLSPDECETLLAFARQPDAPWALDGNPGDTWYARKIHPFSLPPPILTLMERIRVRAARHIKADYAIADRVFADTLQLVRWRPGDSQLPHADCENFDGRPHPFPWRAFASIIYLNDEYEGGQLFFPGLGLRPHTPPGTLAYFPSTRDYVHGVEEVTAGTRYTLACFYTFDERRDDAYAV